MTPKDKNKNTRKYIRMCVPSLAKLTGCDESTMAGLFEENYLVYVSSEEYDSYMKKYPTVSVEKIYAAITYARLTMESEASLDEV